jgi:signal peptidase II
MAIVYAIFGCLIFALDRLTKQWALAHAVWPLLDGGDTPWLTFDLVYNRGIAWSVLHSSDDTQFSVVSLVIVMITIFVGIHALSWFYARRCIAGHILIIAGSLSNIADRYWYGGVIDFIHLHYGQWSWPIFNVADLAIVAGAIIIMLMSMRE